MQASRAADPHLSVYTPHPRLQTSPPIDPTTNPPSDPSMPTSSPIPSPPPPSLPPRTSPSSSTPSSPTSTSPTLTSPTISHLSSPPSAPLPLPTLEPTSSLSSTGLSSSLPSFSTPPLPPSTTRGAASTPMHGRVTCFLFGQRERDSLEEAVVVLEKEGGELETHVEGMRAGVSLK